jgi:large subunit ribosomal protein L15
VVRLDALAKLAGDAVTAETLVAAGLARAGHGPIKLLANGDAPRAFTVSGIKVSAGAKARIEAAGGRVES